MKLTFEKITIGIDALFIVFLFFIFGLLSLPGFEKAFVGITSLAYLATILSMRHKKHTRERRRLDLQARAVPAYGSNTDLGNYQIVLLFFILLLCLGLYIASRQLFALSLLLFAIADLIYAVFRFLEKNTIV